MSLYDAQTISPTITGPTEQPTPTNTPSGQAITVMSPTQAQQALDAYGIDPSQTLTADNITQTLTRPTAAPDDLLGIRDQLNYDLGVTTAQNKLNQIKSQYYKAPSVIEGQRLNMGVLRGETALAQERLMSEMQAQQDTVNSLVAERDYRLGIAEKNIDLVKQLKLQYAGAGIKYGDSMDTIESKLVGYEKSKKKEAEKDALKATAREIGISTKGLSSKEIEKKLKKYYKSEKSYKEAVRSKELQSSDISLALQKIQLAKAQESTQEYNPASAFGDKSTAQSSSGNNGWSVTTSTSDNPSANSGGINWGLFGYNN